MQIKTGSSDEILAWMCVKLELQARVSLRDTKMILNWYEHSGGYDPCLSVSNPLST